MTNTAAIEIAHILLQFEIERQKKTVDSATPGQQAESKANKTQPAMPVTTEDNTLDEQ